MKGSCHCGAVNFVLAQTPQWLTQCNCSICRRIGGLWAHAFIGEVTINCAEDATHTYVWGDKTLAIHTCKTCGCTTHWQNLQTDGEHMAVNGRMMAPEEIAELRIRRFDGADTWAYLD